MPGHTMPRMSESTFLHIENAAHSGAFGNNAIPEPTEAQCVAGNYKVGRAKLYGLALAIEQPRGSYRTGIDAKTGKRWASRMAAHYGYIGGTKGKDGDGVDCFIGFYPQSETAYVINQNVDGRFDETKVMLAFPDEDTARRAYLDSYERGWKGLASIVPASISQLKWWLKNGDLRRPLRADKLPHEGLETMTRKVQWNSDALPYDSTLDHVLYEIRCADAGDGLLMDAVTVQEIVEDAEGVLAFDALVSPYAKLERKMELLRGVMERTGDKVKPVALQITEPFKQRGVANVAAIFELSDGQTVSIYFHNPDVTPGKMTSTDEVISWKWLLNKKDITIVVAPERGADLNVREVARRIMRLAEKNSPAFQRLNAKRAERMGAIQSLKDEITGLETELAAAQHELEVAKVAAEDAASAPVPNPAQDKRDQVLAGQTVIMSDRELNDWIDDGMPGDVASMPNPNQVGTLDQWLVGLKSNPDIKAARVAAGIEPAAPRFAVGQRVRFGAGPYEGNDGIVESINPDTGRMVVRGPTGTGFGVTPANAAAWQLAVLEDQVPFHKMTPDQQRAAMAAEKSAVSDEQVDQFLAAWGGLTTDYMTAGYRVAGRIVAGAPDAFRVEAGKVEAVSPDGMTATDATADQVDELRDAIRGGQVQVELYPRWGGSVDSTVPIEVLHQATGKFKLFEGKFELPNTPAAPASASGDILIVIQRQLDDEITWARQGTFSPSYLESKRTEDVKRYLAENAEARARHEADLASAWAVWQKNTSNPAGNPAKEAEEATAPAQLKDTGGDKETSGKVQARAWQTDKESDPANGAEVIEVWDSAKADALLAKKKEELEGNAPDYVARQFIADHMQGRMVKTTIGDCVITHKTGGKIALAANRKGSLKLETVARIPEILTKGEVGEFDPKNKVRGDKIDGFYPFTHTMAIEDKRVKALIKVGRRENELPPLVYTLQAENIALDSTVNEATAFLYPAVMYVQRTSMETGLGKAVANNVLQPIPEVNPVLDSAEDGDGLNIEILAVWDADGNLIPELADGYEEPAADEQTRIDADETDKSAEIARLLGEKETTSKEAYAAFVNVVSAIRNKEEAIGKGKRAEKAAQAAYEAVSKEARRREAALIAAEEAYEKATAPAPVTLSGKELGDFPDTPEGLKELRKAAIDYLKKMRDDIGDGKESLIDCPILGQKVGIRRRGILEVKNFSADKRKLMLIPKIRQIIGSAYEKSWEANYKKEAKPTIEGYWTLESKVELDGTPLTVDTLIEKDPEGSFHYDFFVDRTEAKTALDSAVSATERLPNHKFDPSADSNVPQDAKKVNGAEDQPSGVLDDAEGGSRWVLNLFIEGEEAEYVDIVEGEENQGEAMTDADPAL
jgi:hypothetical protein